MTLFAEQPLNAPNFEEIPQELKNHPKWMVWRAERTKKNPNIVSKVPYRANGYKGSKSDPEHWLTFEEVKEAYETENFDGVGIVFNRDDNLVCVDLDDFEDMKNLPAEKYNLTIHSYTELSPSEKGLHIWIKGKKPEWCTTKKNGVEFYGGEKYSFVTVTGYPYHKEVLPVEENQKLIDQIAETYFKEDEKAASTKERNKEKVIYKEFPDHVVLSNMFESKNGKKIKALFDGDISNYESASDADMGLCNHLAYWTNNNPDQMDRLFRNSALIRDKWDEKRGNDTYGDITINEAIAGNEKLAAIKEEKEQIQSFVINEKGRKIVCLHNTQLILDMLEANVYYDVIKKRSFIESGNKIYNGYITDYHVVKVVDFGISQGYKVSKNTMIDHLMALSKDHAVNKVTNYFDQAKNNWDGISRIEEVFNTLHSKTDRELALSYFKKWCIQAVRLAYNTDGRMNQEFILVLQGGQGLGKTTWFKMLCEPIGLEYFKESMDLNPDNKDAIIECVGYFIVELGELDATMKHEQSKLKQFITKSMDEVRKPFERLPELTPRQTILCATVNEEDFLKDKTGNRRYAIIKTDGQIDRLSHIDLEQFWGEIVTLAANGESHHLDKGEKEKQTIENSYYETLNEAEIRVETNFQWGAKKEDWIKVSTAVICESLGLPKNSKNVTQALRKRGCEYHETERPRKWTVPPMVHDLSKGHIYI